MTAEQPPLNVTELLNGPALDPPAGVDPDFDNNGGLHGIGYFVIIFCSIISTFALVFRITAKISLRSIRTDDVCMMIAFVGRHCSMFHYGELGALKFVSNVNTALKVFFVAYEYPVYQWAIYPGIKVHQWNVPLGKMESYLYVSSCAIPTSSSVIH